MMEFPAAMEFPVVSTGLPETVMLAFAAEAAYQAREPGRFQQPEATLPALDQAAGLIPETVR